MGLTVFISRSSKATNLSKYLANTLEGKKFENQIG